MPIMVGESREEAAIFLVGGNRLVVLRGTGNSFNGVEPEEDDEGEIEPLEIICYEIR